MDALRDYLAMGGFAAYVWPAYIIVLGVMAGMVVVTLRGLRAERQALAEIEANSPQIAARRAARASQNSGQTAGVTASPSSGASVNS